MSSGFGVLSSATQSLGRTTAAEAPLQLLRLSRSNRSSAYLPLLYRWKLIDSGEELRVKTNVSVVVLNISNRYVNLSDPKSMLMLVSDVLVSSVYDS